MKKAKRQPYIEKGSEHEKTPRYLAHVRCDGETFVLHDLDEHLHGVGKLADRVPSGPLDTPARLRPR